MGDITPAVDAAANPLDEAMRRLAGGIDDAPGGTAGSSATHTADEMRELLAGVHRAAMQAAADSERADPDALGALADAVRTLVPAGVEDRMTIRETLFIRLLRRGALEPAWTLAQDSSAGVVRAARTGMMWAGGSQAHIRLPLPTLAERGRAYAWLPGFRDPRWGVPDAVYDITSRIGLRLTLTRLDIRSGRLHLAGAAWLSALAARPDDVVTVVLRGPGGATHRVPAVRARTAEQVRPAGPGLTRLAWAGWHATVDPAPLRAVPGRHGVMVELAQGALRRDEPLGLARSSYCDEPSVRRPQQISGRDVSLVSEPDGQLGISVDRSRRPARLVPAPLRAALREVTRRR